MLCQTLLGVVRQVPTGLGDALPLGNFVGERVGDCRGIARDVDRYSTRARQSRVGSGRVHGKSDSTERGRVHKHSFPTLMRFGVGPQTSSRRERGTPVHSVDRRVDWASLVPRVTVVVYVGK